MANVQVTFGASLEKLIEGVEGARSAIEGFKQNAERLAEALGIAFSVEKLVEFVEHMGELGLQTERTMAMLGTSAEQTGVLGGVAKLTGSSLEGVTTSIERMSLNIQKSTRDAFNPAAQGLKVLGLSAKDLIGVPTEQYFLKLSEAVSKFNPSLNLTNAVMAVGGRGVAQLLPMLQLGAEHFREMEAEIKKTGSTLDDAQAHAFAQTHEKLTLMNMSVEGLGIRIFSVLKPAIDGAIEWFTKFVQSIDQKRIQSALTAVIDAVANMLLSLIDVAESLGKLIDEVADKFKLLAVPLVVVNAAATGLNKAIDAVVNTLTFGTGKVAEHTAAVVVATGKYDELRAKIDAARIAADRYAAGLNAGATGDAAKKLNAPGINMDAKSGVSGQIEQFQTQIKLADEAYRQTQENLASELKLHQITQDQETQSLLAALDKRRQAELASLDAEAQIGGLSKAQYQKIADEKLLIDAKYKVDHDKIVNQGLQADVKAWESTLAPLQSAFDSQLKGLLAGTTSWATAMKNIFADLVMDIIKAFEKIAFEKLALSLANMFGDPAAMIAGATRAITTSVGQLYAGEAAFFAPTLGPAAPAAAAGVAAGVQATAISMAALDTGAWSIPREGMAMLHPNEMVLPPAAAQTFRDMASGNGVLPGGGNNITFQVSALDGPGVQAFFQKNASLIARVLQAHMNQNPSYA